MMKIECLLKKADYLSLVEFRNWWVELHVPHMRDRRKPYLDHQIVNVRLDSDELFGKPRTEIE
jgi:hypothetical protein